MVDVTKKKGRPEGPLTPVCAIGASAGGVAVLQKFFECIDPELGLANVVIVHLPLTTKAS